MEVKGRRKESTWETWGTVRSVREGDGEREGRRGKAGQRREKRKFIRNECWAKEEREMNLRWKTRKKSHMNVRNYGERNKGGRKWYVMGSDKQKQ